MLIMNVGRHYTVEPQTNDHPHQRPSLLYDHISCDGQWFLFVYESLTSDHPSYTTTPIWFWWWSYKRDSTVVVPSHFSSSRILDDSLCNLINTFLSVLFMYLFINVHVAIILPSGGQHYERHDQQHCNRIPIVTTMHNIRRLTVLVYLM